MILLSSYTRIGFISLVVFIMNRNDLIAQITHPKTKWAEYFLRFYENHTDLFWKFRELNHDTATDTSSWSEFQQLGRKIEAQMFYLENLLTSRQTGDKAKWLDKTVTAFYDLVESYFPLYGKIE